MIGVSTSPVIVIGAGPAGSISARILAENKKRVILLDKERYPREKLCGGGLTPKAWRVLREQEVSLPSSIIKAEEKQTMIYYHYQPVTRITIDKPIRYIYRKEFDEVLVKEAVKEGVEFYEGERVTKINFAKGEVWTTKRKFKGEWIIGADGINSIVVKAAGLRRWQRKGIAAAVEIEAPKETLKEKGSTRTQLHFGVIRKGYGWVFPKGKQITVGLGGNITASKGLRRKFENYLERILERPAETGKIKGYKLPFGGYLSRPVFTRTLIVGDAAGFAEGLLGEGIYYAMKSGEIAANALIYGRGRQQRVMKAYIENIKEITRELKYAHLLQKLFYSRLEKAIMTSLEKVEETSQLMGKVITGTETYQSFFRKAVLLSPKVIYKMIR